MDHLKYLTEYNLSKYKHFENKDQIDPFGEEDWEEKDKIIKPIMWYNNTSTDGQFAIVGELVIAYYFTPKISRSYHLKIGFGNDNLNYVKNFRGDDAEQQIHQYVENWWNDFVEKII